MRNIFLSFKNKKTLSEILRGLAVTGRIKFDTEANYTDKCIALLLSETAFCFSLCNTQTIVRALGPEFGGIFLELRSQQYEIHYNDVIVRRGTEIPVFASSSSALDPTLADVFLYFYGIDLRSLID